MVSHCGAPPVSLLLKIREHKMFCHPPYEKTSQQAETIIFKDITEAKTQSTQTPGLYSVTTGYHHWHTSNSALVNACMKEFARQSHCMRYKLKIRVEP